jgi:hypothetical protein
MMVAGIWDLSWHRSIGRDTFFTPPHSVLYFGALLSCLVSASVIVRATFGRSANPSNGVSLFGLTGPLGTFVVGWGGLTMLAAGWFDNWWHGVYGLDVVVESLPHIGIIGGMFGVFAGSVLLAVAWGNAGSAHSRWASALVVHTGGMVLALTLAALAEETFNYLMHGARFFCVVALVVPAIVIGVGRAPGRRHGVTNVALFYTLFTVLLILLLPLFRAEPKLGPILHPVIHFVPPPFPLLVLPAAFGMDLVDARLRDVGAWGRAAVDGAIFFSTFALLQWPFASFLHTRFADNRFFAAREFAFFQAETSVPVRRLFFPTESTAAGFWAGMVLALGFAVVSARVGLGASRWLRELRR